MSAKTILASGFLLLGGALLLVVSSLDYSCLLYTSRCV